MENLNEDFILSDEEINSMDLFNESEDSTGDVPPEKEEQKKEETIEENINPESLFTPESVDSNDNKQQKEETPESTKESSHSPNSNIFYSIANALVEDGVLSDLEEDFVKNIKSSEDFAEAIDQQVIASLTEAQQRINSALNADVDVDSIREYEQVLQKLDNITDDIIKDESEKGITLRKQLIYQDFINRGFSKERAEREVRKSFDSGSDIEDAKDARDNNKSYFKNQYETLIQEGEQEAENQKRRFKEETESLKKQLLEDKDVFDGLVVDKITRQKAFDNIAKATYKDENGKYITAIQKYQKENPVDFRKKLGLIFTLTDGFKNVDKLVKTKVKKEVKSSLKELESKLRNSSFLDGNPTLVGNYSNDNSYNKGWDLDI